MIRPVRRIKRTGQARFWPNLYRRGAKARPFAVCCLVECTTGSLIVLGCRLYRVCRKVFLGFPGIPSSRKISRMRDMTGIDPPLNIATAIIGTFKGCCWDLVTVDAPSSMAARASVRTGTYNWACYGLPYSSSRAWQWLSLVRVQIRTVGGHRTGWPGRRPMTREHVT